MFPYILQTTTFIKQKFINFFVWWIAGAARAIKMKICFVYQQLYIKKPVLMKGDLSNENTKRRFVPR
jgi:hypothetical protein